MVRFACLPLCRALLAAALLLGPLPAGAQTADEIGFVQAWLATEGYDPGPADGIMGPRTREAIRAFETEHGREPTGEISDWLIEAATAPEMETGEGAGEGALSGAVATLSGDPGAVEGTGGLAFSQLEDGALLITDGFPWRPGVMLEPRVLEIVSTGLGLFQASPESPVPVPLDSSVVDVPGSTFVPLFLAQDRASALRGSLADAAGVTWRFADGGLRFEAPGYVLTAAEPGATISFRPDGVLLEGFELAPQ